MSRQRVLVFAPGIIPSDKPVQYYLPEHPKIKEGARLAPVALIKLQETLCDKRRPDRVIALCTEKVKTDRLPSIKEEFRELGIDVDDLDIPDGRNAEQIREIVRVLLQSVPNECDLVLDVTHGFRSVQIVFSSQRNTELLPGCAMRTMRRQWAQRIRRDRRFASLDLFGSCGQAYLCEYIPRPICHRSSQTCLGKRIPRATAAVEGSLSRFSDALDLVAHPDGGSRGAQLTSHEASCLPWLKG